MSFDDIADNVATGLFFAGIVLLAPFWVPFWLLGWAINQIKTVWRGW